MPWHFFDFQPIVIEIVQFSRCEKEKCSTCQWKKSNVVCKMDRIDVKWQKKMVWFLVGEKILA